jgi:hypothetical protein
VFFAVLMTVVLALFFLAGILIPFLIDGRHWWPRRKKK